MYGLFTYIWVVLGVNVGKYTIHSASGYRFCSKLFPSEISQAWKLVLSRTPLVQEMVLKGRGFSTENHRESHRGFLKVTPKKMPSDLTSVSLVCWFWVMLKKNMKNPRKGKILPQKVSQNG